VRSYTCRLGVVVLVSAPSLSRQRSDLKHKHVDDLYPQFFEKAPHPNMAEFVRKLKWDAPKRPQAADEERSDTKKARGDAKDRDNDHNRGLLSSCSVQ
jgi:hypothetical protein